MANNIIPLDPNNFSSEVYSPTDESLITSNLESNQFDLNTDYVEYFVFDLNNNQISPLGNDASFSDYLLLDNEIYIDPIVDLFNIGIDTGIVNTLYNFYRKWLSSSPQSTYYIKEISSNRTEIRLDSNIINRVDIISSTNEFISYRETDENFPDFYINLGSNLLFIANNIQLDDDGTILIKLYEPLPSNIQIKSSLWVVEKISEGNAYRVEFEDIQEVNPQLNYISGPNLNLSIKDELNNPSEEIDLTSFNSPNSQSEYQINSYFNDPSISINIDYSDFSNFINFSSAKTRLENFWDKVTLIESSSNELTILNTFTDTTAISASKATLNGIINNTITNFDSYEYYLYFESSSVTYPKTNSTPPYQNASTGSSAATDWSSSMFESGSEYDRENQNWLKYSIPEYLRDDSTNDQYMTFLNMIGHFVDNDIWVYLKDTTNKWDADNRIDAGVSKDLVAQVLRDMGVKLYQNNFSSTDLYSAFLGFTDSGSLFPFPYMTGSLPTPSGYEYISNFISSSDKAIPLDDINKRIYKRIYHNLPYLLKSKGTVEGLRTLINIYGIPDTILRISEFGGKDKNNVNDWDLWKHQYNHSCEITGSNFISSSWSTNTLWGSEDNVPEAVQLRFKAGTAVNAPTSQSLWSIGNGSQVKLVLEYDTDLPITSGSYSGSIIDSEYQYADLKFTVDNFTTSASIKLPFYNNDWWSVQINRTTRSSWELVSANKIYSGSDGSQIGFIASESFEGASETAYIGGTTSFFPSEDGGAVGNYVPFSGSYQEIRYFNQPLSSSVFRDYTMNPQSTEGNGVNGSPSQLIFRASLGGDLYTGSESIHPKITGSSVTQSFSSNSDFYIDNSTFKENKEWVFYDSPAVGIKNRNTDKIKRQDLVLPSGDTLSNQKSIQQKSYTTDDYTNNLNLLEVAFSPQNQINDDIISQIGHFNIGDYIGDPRLVSSSADTYPSLVGLSKEYFDKYTSSYDVYDYIRLIKFFDNSLFKMVKDFVPSRTGLASGIVVKQHILERQKYPTPQPTPTTTLAISHTTGSTSGPSYQQVKETRKDLTITGSVGSTPSIIDGARYYEATTDFESNPLYTFSGGAGGSVNNLNVPVGYFRVLNTGIGFLDITSTYRVLFQDSFWGGTLTNNTPSANGINISPKGVGSNGRFTIDFNYTFKGDINIEVSNRDDDETFTVDLVEDSSNDVVSTITQFCPQMGVGEFNNLVLTNCIFEKGKTYYFRIKSNSGSARLRQAIRVSFTQQDAPLTFRSGQMYSEVIKTPLGDVTETVSNSHEFYDGEFSGSAVLITNGELNTECDEFKEASTTEITYNLSGSFEINTYQFLNKLGGADYQFNGSTAAGLGKIYANWQLDRTEGATRNLSQGTNYYFKIVGFGIKIPNSLNGVNIKDYVTSAKEFKILDANFISSNFTTTGWTVSGKQVTGQTSGDITLYPISIQKRQAYPNVAVGGEYFYIETQPSDLTFQFFVDVFDSPGDVDNITVAAKGALATIFDPFIPQTFQNSDCNPLVNNATDITPSTVYYDVDYADNPNVAVNFSTIMSGAAPKAKIQDFNYHTRRNTIPRYEGSKNGNTTNYSVEGASIDATQALFGYFTGWVEPLLNGVMV